MDSQRELDMYRFLDDLNRQLGKVGAVDTLLRATLRGVRDFFDAEAVAVVDIPAGGGRARTRFLLPREYRWDLHLISAFIRDERISVPDELMLARVRRRGRGWGAIAVRWGDRAFVNADRDILLRVGDWLSSRLHNIDEIRVLEVRRRIDRKIMEELRPKDLFYQILRGIRSITRYDHSATLFMGDGTSHVELVAEQIAWSKRKSSRIGDTIELPAAAARWMRDGHVDGFVRRGGVWSTRDETSDSPPDIAVAMSSPDDPPETAMICAPLVSRHEPLGILKVAWRHVDAFGDHEIDLVRAFTPEAVIALHNSHRAESMELRVLEAEKRQAVATLARSVSHDVNNAVGAALPLVQQVRSDAQDGHINHDSLTEDLTHIEHALKFCRRIFGGMLAFARGGAQSVGESSVHRTLESILSVLADSMRRQGISTEMDIDEHLPAVVGAHGDIQQLFLNIASNARDAMPGGGTLRIRAVRDDDSARVTIEDTGEGIPADRLHRVSEPFFTTKPGGTGLGLATCQAIVWRVRGEITVDSEPGQGTRVTVRLPFAAERVDMERVT